MSDWNPQANALFVRAAEMSSAAERDAFLARECGQDAELRRQVDSLLAASNQAGDFLMQPAFPPRPPADATAVHRSLREAPGTVIGPYKLLQEIGEGGFGVVFMAQQEKPVRRMVALKIIKPGMDTEQVIARFESERQALAIMDHPHIARVLDAGATDTGRPYFVMELVKGVPITEFCDRNHMPAAERLKLFIDICRAIQHAHHKGIIHRDIKPSNVLVTLHDTVPVVKVIDFGVAKATVQKLTEKTMFTAYGQMIGTPAYMSPEQAEMSGLDIDTRSDIYSLGVLLYELLTGTTPLEMNRLREAGYAEMQRLIREEEAPRPSTRLSSLGDSATVMAGNRGTDPKQLARMLAGDLDWIVMKALEKDRNRRYGTPGNFAEDIERYLRHEAIEARPPSAVYRLRKLARRNQIAVLSGSTVAAALLAGTAVATWQAVRATRAESVALAALAEKEQARREEAIQRRRAEDNEQKSKNNAAIAYSGLGRHVEALNLRQEILAYDRIKYGPDHPETLASMNNLSASYLAVAAQQAWFGQDEELAATCQDALALAKDTQIATLADRVAKACSLRPAGDSTHDGALILARRAVELGHGNPYRAYFVMVLGMAQYRSGHLAEADAALSAAIEGGKGNSHISGTSACFRAMCLFRQGKEDEARQLVADAARRMRPLPADENSPLAEGATMDDLILWLAYKEASALTQLDENEP